MSTLSLVLVFIYYTALVFVLGKFHSETKQKRRVKSRLKTRYKKGYEQGLEDSEKFVRGFTRTTRLLKIL
jgi:putative lipase involved disintegration of autophagic bodies